MFAGTVAMGVVLLALVLRVCMVRCRCGATAKTFSVVARGDGGAVGGECALERHAGNGLVSELVGPTLLA